LTLSNPGAREGYLIGIDLGGTRVKGVALTAGGQELKRTLVDTQDDGTGGFLSAVKSLVVSLTAELGSPLGVGLSAPGLAAADNRSIAFMPGRLQGLEKLNWSQFLTLNTLVSNDAHAALAGEAWIGAAAGRRHAFMLTLGTGVGGAILSDGRVLSGAIGRAGHLGHISLNIDGESDIVGTPGSLEDYIGDHNLAVRSAGRFNSTRDLIASVRDGDEFALAVWTRSIRALACAITSLINVLDPEVVILGGGIAAADHDLFMPLREELARIEWRPGGHSVPIVSAKLGDFAGAIGAAKLAL